MKLKTAIFLLLLTTPLAVSAGEFTPVVFQFAKNDYRAANQNWAVGEDSRGVMYFGNNRGLLSFDGIEWGLNALPRDKTVRSIMVDDNDRIYVGSYEEFGYFDRGEGGEIHYTSLSDSLEGYQMQNDEIWTILSIDDAVIFQSFTSYFIYKDGVVSGVRSPNIFMFFAVVGTEIFTHTSQLGLCRLDYRTGKVTSVGAPFASPMIAVLPLADGQWLFVTQSDGLFIYDEVGFTPMRTDIDDRLRSMQVNRAAISAGGNIVIGTIRGGAMSVDAAGNKLWEVNSSNVLRNNTVLGMLFDREGNLWLALDRGIAFLQFHPDVLYLDSFNPSIGSIYSATYDAPNLYIGTNQGLYRARLTRIRKSIESVRQDSSVEGHVWNISMFDGQIICGTNGATYEITAADSRLICGVEGGMCIARGVVGGEEILVQGTYTMLCIYKKREGRWVFSHALDGFMEPVRSLAIDYTGTIWAGHLHRGLYAVRLSKELDRIENITRYRSLDGVNEVAVGVHAVNNRVVFSDRSGFYTYDDIRKEIVPYNELDSSLGAFAKSYNTVRFGDDYWFITPDEAGLFAIEGTGSVLKEYFSYSLFGNQTVDDNQQIVPLSADACLVTLENGLAIYTVGKSPPAIPQSSLRLKEARATDREQSRRQTLPLSPAERPILGYDMGNVSFTVFYPRYDMMKNIVFRYKLDGLDVVQGEATDSPTKQYQHLPYGKYTFRAEVFTKSGLKLSELAYPFRVRPPFYLSVAAIVFYTLLILLAIWLLYRYVRAVTERKNSKIHAEQQKRIQELENERLEGDLRLKSKELAASTMELIKKNENLIKIKNELTAQKEALGNQYPTKYYRRLVSLIDESISSQEDWAAFLSNFDRIHENFFRNLHHRYPELTANDLRFCAYLRLNLSSKDIASLMNISLKGVEVARYRIRKKIGLPSDKSLTGFMLEMK